MPTVTIPRIGDVYYEPPLTEQAVIQHLWNETLARIQAQGFRDFEEFREHVKRTVGVICEAGRTHK
jgi:hypothetical protein